MKRLSIYLSIYLITYLSVSLNGQVINSQEKEKNEGIQRNATYNLEEIKVRWKKAALENCIGVPCIIIPPPPSFNCGTSTISDIDGNTYNTVLIGTQCWTKENLKVTKYNDGTGIPDETANTAGWGGLATGARSDYTGEASYIATYGYLYNWYAATDSRKICPAGWHVPTDGDWTPLIQFIVPTETVSATAVGTQSTTAGGKMKTTGDNIAGTGLWNSPSTGDNSSGFSALPGGYRVSAGSFQNIRGIAFFWSATESAINSAWSRSLYDSIDNLNRDNSNKSVGSSVRCLKD
jgi:uncharacterized protein (TIGR02145 family)